MKKILGIFLSVLVLSCGTQRFVENNNLGFCTDTDITKDMFTFNVEWFKNQVKVEKNRILEIENDSSKTAYRVKENYDYDYKYSVTSTSKKNNLDTFYRYDSIGRLVMKYNRHTGTDVGEEIKFKYDDAQSTTPIETYRVNYDTIYPVCWKEALQIATKKGVDPHEAEVNIEMPLKGWEPEKPMAWKIFDRKKVVHVDAYTGKVVLVGKPTPFFQY